MGSLVDPMDLIHIDWMCLFRRQIFDHSISSKERFSKSKIIRTQINENCLTLDEVVHEITHIS